MTAYSWIVGTSGSYNWNTAADRMPAGGPPKSGDDATISQAGTYTVNISTADTAHNVTLNNANATLKDSSTLTLDAGGTLALLAGKFILATGGTLKGGTTNVNGGTFTVQTGSTLDGVTYDGTLNVNAANVSLNVVDGITLAGVGGAGAGTINLNGTNDNLFVVDGATLDNAILNIGLANQSDYIYLDSSSNPTPTLTLGSNLNMVQSAAASTAVIDIWSYTGTNGTLINKGTITAKVSGGTFQVLWKLFR